jgi:hypothetical protein
MFLLAALLAPTASASPILTGEVQSAAPYGTGLGVRLGVPIDAVLVRVVPEGGVTVWTDAGVTPFVGARVALGKVLEPGAYAHALVPLDDARLGWDAGASIDFTAIPMLSLGATLGAVDLGAGPALAGGLHAGLKF